MIMQMEI